MVPLLLIAYFLIRLPNLTLLPIFTDETNYLDWGWRAIHAPGHLWYSLYDAKPPLVMWLFGLSESVVSDPLLAGRLVSVLTGALTLLGLYFLGKKLFSPSVAVLAPIFYLLSPLFHLYDRQALMESALAAVFVWLIYFVDQPVVSGLLLGLGLLIKPTALLFFAPFLLIYTLSVLKSKNFGRSILYFLLSIFLALLVTLPMLLQPIWQKTSSLTGQYLHFPSPVLFANFATVADILFWFLTPPILIFSLIGLVKFRRTHWPLIVWVFLPLLIQVLTGKFLIHRYLAPFLPPLLLFAAAAIRRRFVFFLTLVIPAALVLLQTLNPPDYFRLIDRFTSYSYIGGYVTSEPSGYNVRQAIDYFSHLAKDQQLTLGIGLFSGESIRTMFTVVVSLSVSVIPEGLPIVMTLVLATGVWRMSKRSALIKKLQAVEALGQARVIAVDKTGTITKNELVVRQIWTADKLFEVGGIGYEPTGDVKFENNVIDAANHPELLLMGKAVALCASARLSFSDTEKRWYIAGDPTEAAMVVFGKKIGFNKDDLLAEMPVLSEMPFDYRSEQSP